MESYDHVIQIDEKARQLHIFRLDSSGKRTLFTSTNIPQSEGWIDELGKFARQLGENLLADSPIARKLLSL
jgi:hypothetical protein